MKNKIKQAEPFFMLFPWGKVAVLCLLFFFSSVFVYRLSETGGIEASRACLMAMIVAGLAGGLGLYVIGKTWRRDVYFMLAGAMIAMIIRMLIGGGGVAIITLFTDIHRSWFVLFLGIYYLVFLVVDTWLALWVVRNSELKDRKKPKHGNLWDFVG